MCACVCVCASVHVCVFMLVHPFLSVVYVHSVFQVGVFEANVVHSIFAFLRQSVMSMFYYCTKYVLVGIQNILWKLSAGYLEVILAFSSVMIVPISCDVSTSKVTPSLAIRAAIRSSRRQSCFWRQRLP